MNLSAFLLLEPRSDAEILIALRAVKERKAVIVNLEHLSLHLRQRAVDRLAGCSCAIDGKSYWLGKKTYLFTPGYVKITQKEKPPKVNNPLTPSRL
jgi:cell division inhibitor SepF